MSLLHVEEELVLPEKAPVAVPASKKLVSRESGMHIHSTPGRPGSRPTPGSLQLSVPAQRVPLEATLGHRALKVSSPLVPAQLCLAVQELFWDEYLWHKNSTEVTQC